jgi:ubiquinone/menaquinone biosynthesis C-methylase UbiE
MNKEDWSNSWKKHLETYLKGRPRTGIFVRAHVKGIASTLELGCGSGRDSIYLAQNGFDAVATDYEPSVISKLQEQLKDYPVRFCVADAFDLPFQDNSFDLVFHNGLFVLFDRNQDIVNMLCEQQRVSKRYVLILVHNKDNRQLVDRFKAVAPSDPVYDIRFFTKDDLKQIVQSSHINVRNIRYLKFGGKADALNHRWFKKIIPNLLYLFRNFWIPRLYQWQRWKKTERIACLIELQK